MVYESIKIKNYFIGLLKEKVDHLKVLLEGEGYSYWKAWGRKTSLTVVDWYLMSEKTKAINVSVLTCKWIVIIVLLG